MTDGAENKRSKRKRTRDLMQPLRRQIPDQLRACGDHERVADSFGVWPRDVLNDAVVYLLRREMMRDGFGRPIAREMRPAGEPRRAA